MQYFKRSVTQEEGELGFYPFLPQTCFMTQKKKRLLSFFDSHTQRVGTGQEKNAVKGLCDPGKSLRSELVLTVL